MGRVKDFIGEDYLTEKVSFWRFIRQHRISMIKITGLDKLQRGLAEVQRAMSHLDGELATVRFDPHDPSSIEAAI